MYKKLWQLFMQLPEGGISDESARLLPDSLGRLQPASRLGHTVGVDLLTEGNQGSLSSLTDLDT